MSSYPADTQLYGGLGLVLTTLLLLALARWMARTEATLTRRQKRQLLDKQEFVRWNMLLYRTFLYSLEKHLISRKIKVYCDLKLS